MFGHFSAALEIPDHGYEVRLNQTFKLKFPGTPVFRAAYKVLVMLPSMLVSSKDYGRFLTTSTTKVCDLYFPSSDSNTLMVLDANCLTFILVPPSAPQSVEAKVNNPARL